MTKITKLLCLAQLKDTDPDLLVDSGVAERKCGNCKKSYKPTDADIFARRPSTHWKQCEKCREYLRQRAKVYLERKKNQN